MKKWLWKAFKFIFHLVCIIAAISLSSGCFRRYHENRNTLYVRDQNFQTKNSSTYPTVSLCFSMPFKTNKLEEFEKGLTPNIYSDFLMGKENFNESLLKVKFKEVSLQLNDFLIKTNINTKNIGIDENSTSIIHSISTLNVNVFLWRFLKCFSFNIPYHEGVIINRLLISHDQMVLSSNFGNIM